MSRKKSVVITGGTKGIGAVIAERFRQNGYIVIIGARNLDGYQEAASDDLRFVQADVRKRVDHVKLVDAAVKFSGGLDAYINCAGVSIWKPCQEVDEAFWTQIMDTNAAGTFWGCQAAAAAMAQGGVIINISSLAGKRGSSNNSVYCASKFAVNGITQSLAKELGPRKIRVNAVCPVYIETEMILEQLKDARSPSSGQDVATYLKDFASSQAALKRLPLASDIADTCFYLASDQSGAITGQCINVDCGVLPS